MIVGLLLWLFLSTTQGLVDGMAQDHADTLINADSLYHSDIGPLFTSRGGPCEWAGEVIYKGGDPDARWDAYAASPSHNQVVNTPRTHHGVGIAKTAAEVYIVVDIFCREASPTTTSPPTTSPPTTTPPATSPPATQPPPLVTTTTLPSYLPRIPPILCPAPGRICIE